MNIENLSALVNIKDLKRLDEEKERLEKKIELYQKVMKNVELFLTFWYEQTSEFGKVKDDFNDLDQIPCTLLVKNGKVKLKIEDYEENSDSN